MKELLLSLICFLAPPAAYAAIEEHPRIAGLVEVPKLFGVPDPKGPPGAKSYVPGKVIVFAQPQKRKWPPPRAVEAPEDLASEEFAYEQPAAVVLSRKPGWYEVKLKDAKGWISKEETAGFHPLEELVTRSLSYMTPAWDRTLRDKPETSARLEAVKAGTEPGAQVLASKRTREGLWLQVRVLSGTGCAGEEPKALGTGWVPAHALDGRANVWFFARGC